MDKVFREEIDNRNKLSNKNYTNEYIKDQLFVDYQNETINLSKAERYCKGVFDAKINLVLYHIMKSDNTALDLINECERIILTSELGKESKLDYYRVLSMYHIELEGDYSTGIECTKKAIDMAEDLEMKSIIIRLKSNLGVVNNHLGFFDVAKDLLVEAVDYCEINNDESHLVYDYLNLGNSFTGLKMYELAEVNYIKSYELAVKMDNKPVIQHAASALGEMYMLLDDFDSASKILSEAIQYSEASTCNQYKLDLISIMMELYIKTEQIDDALELLEVYQEEFEHIDNMNTRHLFYKRAALISQIKGDFKSAYEYMVKYDSMYQKLVALNSEKTMNEVIRDEYKKTLTRLEMVAKVGRDITMYDDLDQVLLFALDALSSFISIDSIGIGILKDEELQYQHFFNEGRKLSTKSIPLTNKNSLAVWSIINNKELISNDIESDNVIYTNEPLIRERAKQSSDLDINSVMFLPLVVKRETVGVFTLQSYKKYAYSKEDMEIFNIIGSYVAIALKNIKQAEDLEKLSTTDGLTGLLNRRGLTEKFEEKILTQPRSIGMIMLDLDLFKQVNDLYGHLFGDKVLKSIGAKLKAILDKGTLLSRMGGEEFAIILFDRTQEEIQAIAEEIRQSIEDLVVVQNETRVSVTTSVGVSYEKKNLTYKFKNYYHKADEALYKAKAQGRNCVIMM